jgi:tetratricopeptide (TPR) repeat protein
MAPSVRQVRVFVSSPGDARVERSRVERAAERLNGELPGIAQLITIRWEASYYRAHATFQEQIPEAARCDIVIAIFRGRLGTELPPDFRPMVDGKPYPSGTAYEVLSAIEAAKGQGLPDVFVFRYSDPPSVQLDDPQREEIEAQWHHLKRFFEDWFQSADGKFKAAFQTFASTDDFESQVELLLRKWLEEKVLQGRSVIWPTALKGSPFRGLASFRSKHSAVFFGRSRDVTKAVDRLKDAYERGCPFLLVNGGSGAGKSSLVYAGLVPRLTTPGVVPAVDIWRVAAMRPGELGGDPFAALSQALFARAEDLSEDDEGQPLALPELRNGDFGDVAELGRLLRHGDDTALKPVVGALVAIERAARANEGHDRDVKAALLLVVDQLDELFDAQIMEEVRTGFARLLALLARSGRVWIVTTLRADLFDRFLAQPSLAQLKEEGASYDLAPPAAAELAEIVRGPAAAADLVYETDPSTGERLDERLLTDADRPDLLPLLQFALSQLFEARKVIDGETRLTFAAYRELGGLEGAVDKEAEAALRAVGEAERAALPRLLRDLVVPAQSNLTGGGRSGYDIRSIPIGAAAHDAPSSALVRALVDARILLSTGEGDSAVVRLAHQRVIDSWRRASDIVAQNADFYRIRGEVEEQRRRWEARQRSRDLLIGRGRPLAEAESIVRQFPEEISPAAKELITQSGRRARLFQTMTAAGAIVFALVAMAAAFSARQAIVARDAAVVAQRQAELARQQADDKNHQAEQGIAAADEILLADGKIEQLRGCLGATERVATSMPPSPSKDFFVGKWHVVHSGSSTFMDWLSDGTCKFDQITFGERTSDLKDATCTWTFKKLNDDEFEINEQDNTALSFIHDLRFKIINFSRIHNIDANYDAVRITCPAAENELYQQELQRRLQSAAADPGDPQRQLGVAAIYVAIGNAQSAQGLATQALAAYDRSLQIARELTVNHPENLDAQHELAASYGRVGGALVALKKLQEAAVAYRAGFAIMSRLAPAHPDNAEWQHELASDYMILGQFAASNSKSDALEAYQHALAILQHLAASRPDDTAVQIDLAKTYYFISRVSDPNAARSALTTGKTIVDMLESEHKLTDDQQSLPFVFGQELAKLSNVAK